MNKSNSSMTNSSKYKPLDETALRKLQNDMQPYLKDKQLTQLKCLIEKYERISPHEIENYLFNDIRKFQSITLHKIRDFVRRRIRLERIPNVNGNVVYQSDDSNLVSPYSRDSFSSKSESNLSPNDVNNLKVEIEKLWQYPKFQKEICQILWREGELEICNQKEVAINFANLKQSSVAILNDFISSKNHELQQHLSNENIRIIHDELIKQNLSDDKISDIYKLIRKREKISLNENGRFSVNLHHLTPDTINELVNFLKPAHRPTLTQRPVDKQTGSLKVNNHSRPAPVTNLPNQIRPINSKPAVEEQKSRFTTEQLRTLRNKIYEFTKDARLGEIINIIKEHETVNQETGETMSFNVLKMKDITIEKLFKLVNSYSS